MATRTRAGGRTTTLNPTRTQLQPSTPVDESKEVKCTGHQLKCPKLRAGPKTKNAGRAFYCCPLPRDDPKRCKFFKWHDELFPLDTSSNPPTPSGSTSAAALVQMTNSNQAQAQTLGQSPAARYGRPPGVGPSATNTRVIPSVPVPDEDEDEMEEIDWDKVDADGIERDAIASTPGSTQSQTTPSHLRTLADTPRGSIVGTSFNDRLRDVAGESLGKRPREEVPEAEDRTPKRTATPSNPFILSPSSSSGAPLSPPHAFLSPTLSSLEQLSEMLHRQDRLIRASEQMKKGMRTTIKGLQEKNKQLEDRIKELEKKQG